MHKRLSRVFRVSMAATAASLIVRIGLCFFLAVWQSRNQSMELAYNAMESVSAYLSRKFTGLAIEDNYSQSISPEALADTLYVNMNYLSELFSKRMGITFTQYKNRIRIEHAKDMLVKSGASMTDIAMRCGFNSASRFSKVFHQITGVSPVGYQNSHCNSR